MDTVTESVDTAPADGTGISTEAPAQPDPSSSPAPSAETVAPASAPADGVSRSDYDGLQQRLSRAEGRAKSMQRLLSVAKQYGYNDVEEFADAMQNQYQAEQAATPQPTQGNFESPDQRPTTRSDYVTEEMIDQRIDSRLKTSEMMSTHNTGRDSENQLISGLISSDNFKSIFGEVEQGDYGSIFDAAYSGAGSAASEIVASAIDNAIFGASEKYGTDYPENLQGKSMPIKDPAVIERVQSRVMDGLKELAAMAVFNASAKGLSDPKPVTEDAVGQEIDPKASEEDRQKAISEWAQGRYDDLSSPGEPASS
jgi:hypothetical protein